MTAETVAVVSSVVVGVVFLVAGVSKLVARDRWRSEAAGMRTPAIVVKVLPVFEVVLGALLVAQVVRPLTAAIAALVLLAFTMAILARIAEGERPPCACFGSWSSRPLGAVHVVRNTVLIVVAMLAVLL